jgi:hypothetical protein
MASKKIQRPVAIKSTPVNLKNIEKSNKVSPPVLKKQDSSSLKKSLFELTLCPDHIVAMFNNPATSTSYDASLKPTVRTLYRYVDENKSPLLKSTIQPGLKDSFKSLIPASLELRINRDAVRSSCSPAACRTMIHAIGPFGFRMPASQL